LEKDFKSLDSLITKIIGKGIYYGDFNKWKINYMFNSYEEFAYFTARLMHYINIDNKKEGIYIKENRNFYRGVKMTYSSILPYIISKEKVIILSSFIAASEEKSVAEKFAGREKSNIIYRTNLYFSVIFYIKNIYKNGWVPSMISFSTDCKEEENLKIFLPFTFYYVKDVKIDTKRYTADIYLETIGKTEILEEKIKMGKKVEYNEKENIIKIIDQ